MLNYPAIFQRFGIPVVGVLHLGGFVGAEDATYRSMGFTDRLFVEAQPDTFEILRRQLADGGARCENTAICDRKGTAEFHVLENGQSSSLLPPLEHLKIYPTIRQTRTITVPTTTIDDLVAQEEYRDMRFNFINIDLQGAEMMAFRGGARTLQHIDAINAEICFDQLYDGTPHVRDVDAFLGAYGFTRVDTVSAHRTWGDGFYVKDRFTKHAATAAR